MALNTSAFTGGLFQLLGSLFFWLILLLIFVVFVFGFLVVNKKRKLTIPFIEVTDLGRSKAGIKSGKKKVAGYFKHNSTFFGLWDYGYEEVCKTKDGRLILNVSSEDFHEINGKMGLIVQRAPEDPRILVPINKCKLENGELLNKIAPADYRGVVVDIIKKAEKETQDKVDKVMQWFFWGGIIIFSFIAIILITQMVKNGQTEAKDLILEAGKINTENLKAICQGVQHTGEAIASSAP
jgi:hypothetical protein